MTELTYKYFDKLNSLINEEEIDGMTTVTQEYKDSFQEKIDALQRELDSLKVKKEWCNTQDTLILRNGIERIEVECNQSTWYKAKNEPSSEDILFLDIYESENSESMTACTAITLEQMIQLRDYLTHKIEYLQS